MILVDRCWMLVVRVCMVYFMKNADSINWNSGIWNPVSSILKKIEN